MPSRLSTKTTSRARPPSPWSLREPLLASPAWLDYVRAVAAIDPGPNPFLGYMGLNFTERGLKNVKFYFAFFRRLTPEELDVVLPVANRGRFDEFYPQWHPSGEVKALHRGTTFALKVDLDGSLTHYYHLRVKGMPLGPPERLVVQPEDEGAYHGVCEEFKGGRAHLKRYFYLQSQRTIAESLEWGGLSPRGRWVEWLEYIESDGRDKLSWVSADPRLILELIDRRGGPELGQMLTELCASCGVGLFAPGSSRDLGDHALYLFPHQRVSAFDGIRPFVSRYLGLPELPAPGQAARPSAGRRPAAVG